ncbi:MAG TPA: MFS transporter [Mycobacteriales bacterium]|nr:MFS transporter [Mycobacteriales bacterium]
MNSPEEDGSVGLAAAVVLVAINLRLVIASLGPELDNVRAGLGLSSAATSVLTALPVFCFGVLALVGPVVSHRLGLRRALLLVLAMLTAGSVLRIGPDAVTLFAGTLLAAAGIAIANVLMPVVARREFPRRTGLMLGLSTTATIGSVALAGGLTVPIADALDAGWRAGLGIWAALSGLTLLVWLPFAWRRPLRDEGEAPRLTRAVLRSPLAWMITVFFGLQSLNVYVVVNWLPSIYQDHGYSDSKAGGLLALLVLIQLPVALVVPSLASRLARQHLLVSAIVASSAVGFLGILLSPTRPALLWLVFLGFGQGAAFPWTLVMLVLRARTHAATAQLSTMMQSIGYVIAGVGPLAFGALHAVTNSWRGPLVFVLALLVPELIVGLRAAAPGYVELDDAARVDTTTHRTSARRQ